ncbi:NAD-glutamate dehydrogenase [Gammaproteobacteria bacterium]|nr:NAD-glutamate dehydrogenase [Gammaproteobacteria bacterium]
MDDKNRQLYQALLKANAKKETSILQVLKETNLTEFSETERQCLADLILSFSERVSKKEGAFRHSIIDCSVGRSITHAERPVTNVFIVAYDMPFIVDSTRMIFKKMGCKVLHMLNAVQLDPQVMGLDVEENLSFLWFELDWIASSDSFGFLEERIAGVLYDVFQAVRDWRQMQEQLKEVVTTWRNNKISGENGAENLAESLAFIDWIIEYFTFIGSRAYQLGRQDSGPILRLVDGSGLGVLSDEPHAQTKQYVSVLPNQLEQQESEVPYFYLSKTRTASTIHRPTYTDLLVLRKFSTEGEIEGELRLIGLLTSDAYESNPLTIPFIRKKVEGVLHHAELKSRFLNKSLLYILKTFPREELFQASFAELSRMAIGALSLFDRPQVRLFIRQDVMHHFFSVVLYLPRERYSTSLVRKIMSHLSATFNGTDIIHQPFFSESNLVRIYFVIQPRSLESITYDEAKIETHIRKMAQSWSDEFLQALIAMYGYEQARLYHEKYANAMGVGYQDRYAPDIAVKDIRYIEAMGSNDMSIAVYKPQMGARVIGIKLFQKNVQQVELSDIFPVLSEMGFRVIQESTNDIYFENQYSLMVADLHCEPVEGVIENLGAVEDCIKAYLMDVFAEKTMSDGFGVLAVKARFTARKIEVFRAYAMYLRQINYSLEAGTIQKALSLYPQLTAMIFDLFELRFHPEKHQESGYQEVEKAFLEQLAHVPLLDHDRVFRMYLILIKNTLRTNYYCKDQGPIVFKISTREIADAPKPMPFREAFVFGHAVEGVHLRQSKVARGGLRWSSRSDDYRTEVLGLMKAQQVKNCIIVPSGAKGGFIAKEVKDSDSPDDMAEKGKRAYQLFIHALLDVTDNLVKGEVVHPQAVVCHDGEDPYFVVAADKGTATFSDMANQIAIDRGFWLGDAFASGGSQGYDHKKIGITAKGAWESVKWHFLTLDRDMNQPFTVVGIGDMAGDVFGNGMMLSEQIKLVAAFNHRHIFIDPNPDVSASFKERQRLFAMSRSSWSDYNHDLMSEGGGVYSRSAKHIVLSDQAMKALGTSIRTHSPNQLIQHILMAPVDLLWNGGIGTYVKATFEKHMDVGDVSNDATRVDARQLRCKMIAEGGNLGFTQQGRIQFAQYGGMVNTDFVDNSAGVDCSDHEVNLKIGLQKVMEHQSLTDTERNQVLEEMTGEVSSLVLRHNFEQNVGLSVLQVGVEKHIDSFIHFMEVSEAAGQLDLQIEFLPTREQIQSRMARGDQPLTRPELAVLIAYSKIILNEGIMKSEEWMGSAILDEHVMSLFPKQCRQYQDYFTGHPLCKEILAMSLSSQMVDITGVTFAHHMVDGIGFGIADILKAFVCVMRIFDIEKWRSTLFELVPAIGYKQVEMQLAELGRCVRKAMRWMLYNVSDFSNLVGLIDRYRSVTDLVGYSGQFLSGTPKAHYDKIVMIYGAHIDIHSAGHIASIMSWVQSLEVIYRASSCGVDPIVGQKIYYSLVKVLSISVLRTYMINLNTTDQWDVYEKQYLDRRLDQCIGRLMVCVCAQELVGGLDDAVVDRWVDKNHCARDQWLKVVKNMKSAPVVSFNMVASAVRSLESIIERFEER